MKPVLLHVTWLAVAAGAFYAGSALNKPAPVVAGAATTKTVATGLTAAERAGTLKTSAVSRDASIADFLSRYELGGGKPLTSERMRQAMSEALRETDPVKSTMLFARLLEEMTPENAAESMATLRESISGFEMMRYMPLLAYQWGSVDAKGALAALDEQGNGGGRENMFAKPVVLAGLASKDPAAALKWLSEQKEDMPGKEFYTQSIINGMSKSDPEGAVALAAKQERAEDRSRAAETIAQEKIKGGIESAAAWASTLTDPDMKKGAMQTIANQMARTDVNKAAEYVKQFANDPSASSAIEDVAGRMARSNPQDALKFAESLAGSNQPVAYRESIQAWTRTDSEAASKYVNLMPAGANRDASASAIAQSISREDPASAIAWTGSIADPKVREETLIDVARDYRRTDPDGYNAWLPASGLSAEALEQVNQRGGDRGGWRGGPPGGFGGGFGGGGGFRGR